MLPKSHKENQDYKYNQVGFYELVELIS